MIANLSFEFPDLNTLEKGIISAFKLSNVEDTNLTILKREPMQYTSSFPTEIVTCNQGKGIPFVILCKYGANYQHKGHGHRGGVAYEVQVYRDILALSSVSTPYFYGAYEEGHRDTSWLLIEYLPNSLRLNKASRETTIVVDAARWLGQFHAFCENLRLSTPWLNRYDETFYAGWLSRTSTFSQPLHRRFPWIVPLCESFKLLIPSLVEEPQTVIHGEYYPSNILVSDGHVYPVDWESAALATGEIDLASLTEGWGEETTQRCKQAYQQVRWPHGAPDDFDHRFSIAQLYWQFRWLGDKPDWTLHERNLPRFERLQDIGNQLGLI